MKLTTILPRAEIAPWIHHLWVFTSAVGLPSGDLRVVVPNGRAKLIVPFRNGLTAEGAGRRQHHRQGEIVLVGLWEEPSIISSTMEETCTIGVEFVPQGLQHFVPGDLHELTQRIVPLDEVLDRLGRDVVRRLAGAETVEEAVESLQDFLVERSRAQGGESAKIIEAAMRLLAESSYQMEVQELERRMGYSRRHLHALFMRHVGLAPKRLASVLAFERLYRRFSQEKSSSLLREDALDLFYDQSHFIRTFRRFTGYSPGKFAEMQNEFGRIFYRTRS